MNNAKTFSRLALYAAFAAAALSTASYAQQATCPQGTGTCSIYAPNLGDMPNASNAEGTVSTSTQSGTSANSTASGITINPTVDPRMTNMGGNTEGTVTGGNTNGTITGGNTSSTSTGNRLDSNNDNRSTVGNTTTGPSTATSGGNTLGSTSSSGGNTLGGATSTTGASTSSSDGRVTGTQTVNGTQSLDRSGNSAVDRSGNSANSLTGGTTNGTVTGGNTRSGAAATGGTVSGTNAGTNSGTVTGGATSLTGGATTTAVRTGVGQSGNSSTGVTTNVDAANRSTSSTVVKAWVIPPILMTKPVDALAGALQNVIPTQCGPRVDKLKTPVYGHQSNLIWPDKKVLLGYQEDLEDEINASATDYQPFITKYHDGVYYVMGEYVTEKAGVTGASANSGVSLAGLTNNGGGAQVGGSQSSAMQQQVQRYTVRECIVSAYTLSPDPRAGQFAIAHPPAPPQPGLVIEDTGQ